MRSGRSARRWWANSAPLRATGIVLPYNAIASAKGEPAVWLVNTENRSVSLRKISVARYRKGDFVVTGGIAPQRSDRHGRRKVSQGRPGQWPGKASEMTLNRWYTSLPLFLSISLLVGCDQSSIAGEQASPRPVKSVTATAEQEQTASLPGVVQARIETDLAFRTLGRIVSRKVDVGDLVLKGDVVAEIDPLSLRLAVRSAEADLRDAQAQFDNAALTEKRKRTLARMSAGSVADRDLAEQQLKSAKANVAKATASLAKAHEQLGYAELKAEFDGVVTATFGEMGQTVSAGQPVLRLARLEQRDVVVDVPEAQFRSVRLDDRFEHRPPTRPQGADLWRRARDRAAGGSQYPHPQAEDRHRSGAGGFPPGCGGDRDACWLKERSEQSPCRSPPSATRVAPTTSGSWIRRQAPSRYETGPTRQPRGRCPLRPGSVRAAGGRRSRHRRRQ